MPFHIFTKRSAEKLSVVCVNKKTILWYQSIVQKACTHTKTNAKKFLEEEESSASRSFEISEAKPFSEIPGPLSLPFIGTSYLYLLGVYNPVRPHLKGLKLHKKYGPLVKEEVMPGVQFVYVFDPNDIETVFRFEGPLPERRSHLAIEKFRKERSHMYNTGGLLPTNGDDWWQLRKEFQKGLSAPQCVRTYLPATDEVIKNFILNFLDRANDDVLPLLSRLFLELTCLVAFDSSLNSFSQEEMERDSRSSQLIKSAFNVNSTIVKLDYSVNRWLNKKSAVYNFFENEMLFMEGVAFELVKQKAELLKMRQMSDADSGKLPSLLEQYLSSPAVDFKDVLGMAVDFLLAGIDTTTYTACFALYHISRNERVQKLLREESRHLLGSGDSNLTPDKLAHAPYARAVLKEVFRMSPITVGVGRNAARDLILSGYHVPKGTPLVTQNQVSCRSEKNFKFPNTFLPERWLKGTQEQATVSPYVALPFGHGPRSCIARRLAEQHLLTLLIRVVHKHTLHWNSSSELDCKFSGIINMPDRPVTVRLGVAS